MLIPAGTNLQCNRRFDGFDNAAEDLGDQRFDAGKVRDRPGNRNALAAVLPADAIRELAPQLDPLWRRITRPLRGEVAE